MLVGSVVAVASRMLRTGWGVVHVTVGPGSSLGEHAFICDV